MELIDSMDTELERFQAAMEAGGEALQEGKLATRLERMKRGVEALRTEARERLDESGFEHPETESDGHFRDVRHDLRNRLNPVSLACQGILRGLGHTGEPEAAIMSLDRLQERITESLKLIDCYGLPPETALPDLEPVGPSLAEHEPVVSGRREPFEEEIAKYHGDILLVEDSEEDRQELAEILREAGHRVSTASGGEEALERLASEDFDVVLLDLSMPGKDGFYVLEQLRLSGRLKYLPVIVVTGRRGEEDAVNCITTGAEGFLTKPVRTKLLLAELDRSLEKRRLREREYEQFFPPAVARHFARRPDSLEMEAKQTEVTVLFCDIRGFSAISERLGPTRTVPWLRNVLENLTRCVIDHEGVLVDYTGDEVMAMWGAPVKTSRHAEYACQAAVAMLATLPELNAKWREEIGRETRVGIGLNSGPALVGNIGTKRRLKYGPLGNTVNLASRVQGATSYAKTTLMITRGTREGLPADSHQQTRRLCDVMVKNIVEPVRLFELAEEGRQNWATVKAEYEKALVEFEKKEFPASLATLGNLLVECPDDGPALLLMERVVEAMSNEGHNFDPVWKLPGK